jgi:hypothetical protein
MQLALSSGSGGSSGCPVGAAATAALAGQGRQQAAGEPGRSTSSSTRGSSSRHAGREGGSAAVLGLAGGAAAAAGGGAGAGGGRASGGQRDEVPGPGAYELAADDLRGAARQGGLSAAFSTHYMQDRFGRWGARRCPVCVLAQSMHRHRRCALLFLLAAPQLSGAGGGGDAVTHHQFPCCPRAGPSTAAAPPRLARALRPSGRRRWTHAGARALASGAAS